MVTQKTLKAYEFETMTYYFDYIILSKTNGQHSQVKSLITAMSKAQKKHCLHYFNNMEASEDMEYCKTVLINEM